MKETIKNKLLNMPPLPRIVWEGARYNEKILFLFVSFDSLSKNQKQFRDGLIISVFPM